MYLKENPFYSPDTKLPNGFFVFKICDTTEVEVDGGGYGLFD